MQKPRLIIQNTVECHVVNPDIILYIRSNGNYCDFHLTDGTIMKNVPLQLGQVAKQINRQFADVQAPSFIQVGRQYIVNSEHILSIFPSKKVLLFDLNIPFAQEKTAISPSSAALLALSMYLVSNESHSYLLKEPSTKDITDDEIWLLND